MAEALLIYFKNRAGKISLPPTFDTPTPSDHERHECHTIFEVERIERELQQETRDRTEQEAETDFNTFEAQRRDVRRRIMSVVESSHTHPQLKDFLLGWCQLRDEKRRKYYAEQFNVTQACLEGLNFNHPRTPDELLKESS